jgi:ribonuclease III
MSAVNADWPSAWLREALAYTAVDVNLFVEALTHRSAAGTNNERLEFLGDTVVNLLITEQLFHEYPQASEGDLSRLRAKLVSATPLAEIASQIGLGEVLHMGPGEMKSGGFRRESILSDAFEAVCGAMFLDRGIEAVRLAIEPLFKSRIAAFSKTGVFKDPKTVLQEYLQGRGLPLPCYLIDHVEGEAHEQVFVARCHVQSLNITAQGQGTGRRRAEQVAAKAALELIDQALSAELP